MARHHHYRLGEAVVPKPTVKLNGADPFTRLVVVGIDRGRLTLATLNGGAVYSDVDPADVHRVEV